MILLFCLTSPHQLFASPKLPCPCALYNRELYVTKPLMQGDDVWELQTRLQQLGFYKGACDGIYGKNTAAAVRAFQKTKKQPVTGRVAPATWKALGEGCEHPDSGAPIADAPERNVSLIVDLETMTLTVMDGDRPIKDFPVAAGKSSTPSPIGEWKIVNKEHDWGGPFGVRWMGLSVPWGIYGVHGTNSPWSIGSPVSSGCIRMHNDDVVQVFDLVSVGTMVKIKAPLTWLAGSLGHTLKTGSNGPDVVYGQLLLKETGFYPYYCDGSYGGLTELAVRSYQVHMGLPISGQIDQKTREHMEEKIGLY